MSDFRMVVESVAWVVLLPALVSAVVLVLASLLGGSDRLAGAVAIVGGFFTAYLASGWAELRPTGEWPWIPYLAAFGTLAGLLPALVGRSSVLRWGTFLLIAVLVAAATAWLVTPKWEARLDSRQGDMIGIGLAVFLTWIVLELVATRQPGPRLPLLLFFISMSAAAVLQFAWIGKFAELAGMLAGTLGGATLICCFRPSRLYVSGMIPGVAVFLAGLLLVGCLTSYNNDLPIVCYFLVLFSPLMLWFGGRGWKGGFLQLGAVLLPLAVAVALAVLTSAQDESSEWTFLRRHHERVPPRFVGLTVTGIENRDVGQHAVANQPFAAPFVDVAENDQPGLNCPDALQQ
jgi:hypothetical protein